MVIMNKGQRKCIWCGRFTPALWNGKENKWIARKYCAHCGNKLKA